MPGKTHEFSFCKKHDPIQAQVWATPVETRISILQYLPFVNRGQEFQPGARALAGLQPGNVPASNCRNLYTGEM
jgi:hypothetical protein